jgi:hypothetical protein
MGLKMSQRSAITLTAIVIIMAVDALFSLRGEGPTFRKGAESANINLGYQPNWSAAESLALNRLAEAVRQHPKERFFHIRWVESFFLGWDSENQDWLDYDRQTGGLVEAGNSSLINEPSEEWGEVREALLPGLAKNGFESHFLRDSGCRSYVGG